MGEPVYFGLSYRGVKNLTLVNVDFVLNLPSLFAALFVAILFIQSGLDKVFDWKGNLEWLTGHFSKTFLAGMVPMMLATITLMELATGLAAAAGGIFFFSAR